MGIGVATRTGITSVMNVIGSTIVITPYTISNLDEGYSGQVETDGTPVTEIAIPYDEFKRLMKQKFGNLEVAEFQLAVRYSATFDIQGATKYKATYQGDVYDITQVKRYAVENTLVAYIITLNKRLD